MLAVAVLATAPIALAKHGNGNGNGNGQGHGHANGHAHAHGKSAAQLCREQRRQMGAQAFAQLYGTNHNRRNAFGKCVSRHPRESDQGATINAARQCRAEQKADPVAFANKYGTNRNKRNAFGKCVSQKARAKTRGRGSTSSIL